MTSPYNIQHNGVAERKNRMIMEETKEMLHDQYIPMHLWKEAARTTVYVQNCIPHRVLENKTPVGDIYLHTHSFGQIGLVKPLS